MTPPSDSFSLARDFRPGEGGSPERGRRVLITGGAGFIGSHLADDLLAAGWHVRALDNLDPQVHGEAAHAEGRRPAYLDGRVELRVGDVRDRVAVDAALEGVDAVVHFAAAVGVGQSMYEIRRYTEVNNVGTATLLEAIAELPAAKRPLRLLVASSMSIYGEGLYETADGDLVHTAGRKLADLKAHAWEPRDDRGRPLLPLPTSEAKTPSLSSVYALGKYDQERMALMVGAAYGVATTAMRFFNVYGTRQALSNPYTGVLAIFAGRLLGGEAPMVYEDGEQRRDFVHVSDVARCCRLALDAEAEAVDGEVFNVGSGQPRTVREVARSLADVTGHGDLAPTVAGKYRVGDIRHCFADIVKARRVLGYEPAVDWNDGLAELAAWVERQRDDAEVSAAVARTRSANAELAERGLAV